MHKQNPPMPNSEASKTRGPSALDLACCTEGVEGVIEGLEVQARKLLGALGGGVKVYRGLGCRVWGFRV